ncbi:uncharacterized protein Z520_08804 [Fonsecaea multimorphosa CBS 102226]|uniref:Uncharacterized protein n=1 Tax=Fonsecaea multimorphosa CBS 102226 TaxID=1442371 RepID=A0A0D2JPK0_9EURO|nr:uncharacterized protein Z520_08804 [Fonsecaea multimorphosa CBS 102226]KIX95287.1 hypothetical protein Z520_08804 [Fonsecaea multimorphosa CBS 102226]OAL21088.1 hypothetical protein AYO22_08245 [Fonsecaea multimorphosa]
MATLTTGGQGPATPGEPRGSLAMKKSKHDAPQNDSAKFQRQFQFIEGLNSKAQRRKTRSWVTTQHYRRKRFEARNAWLATDQENEGEFSKPLIAFPSTSKPENEGRRHAADRDAISPDHAVQRDAGRGQSCFLQRLGGGRADPFNSYPVPATRDVHELVDHYYFVIPSLVHRHWARAVRRPRACWDLFNLYRNHEIPFLGMLHHAAHHLAGMRGNVMSLQTFEFKQRALAAVNQSLQRRQGPCDDWTLIGVGLLANAERIWGDREIARMHWGALKRLLLDRGGFQALQSNPTLHTKLVWSFIALSWPTADGNPAYVDDFVESSAVLPHSPSTNPDSTFRNSCIEFTQFINARRSQILKNLPSTPAQHRQLTAHRSRATMFHEGSELANALKSIETGYESPDKRRAVDNCRLACLIHLNLVMAEHGDLSQATEEYLQALQRILDEADDDSSLSAEHLLWTLLTPFRSQGHYERIWKMSRLVGVVKRTSAQTWMAIENALRVFLRLPGSIYDFESALSVWDRGECLDQLIAVGNVDARVLDSQMDENLLGQHDTACSDGCRICPLKPTTF